MNDLKFQYYFDAAISYDNGTTLENVRVGYDYYPAEMNMPHDHDSREIYDVFIFNLKGDDISCDLPLAEFQHIMSETKIHHARMLKEQNEI
jgi:phenylalanyl-tRNA synthetase alpha subunit